MLNQLIQSDLDGVLVLLLMMMMMIPILRTN